MRYMLLIYTDEQAREALSPEKQKEVLAQAWGVIEEASNRGIFKGADPLQPTSTATTVRRQNGKVFVTDGPFVETKEQLGGYFILDCKDLDEALEWAAKIPLGCGGGSGCVEVRPIREMSPRVE
ncbi:MAG TPA: YciI family protein [Terriglobia bacterium]|nr:YciI family protein [Terriglobia bacterium]